MSVRLRKVPNPPGHNRGLGSQRSCVLHTRDVRSAQPLAERMTLQPVVTRDDPTYKTGKHATRSVYIHVHVLPSTGLSHPCSTSPLRTLGAMDERVCVSGEGESPLGRAAWGGPRAWRTREGLRGA